MKKIIVIPAIAALAIVGLAACDTDASITTTTEPTTQSAPKEKAPTVTDVPDSVDAAQWAVIEETGASVGFSSDETAAVVDDVAYVWATEDMSGACQYLFDYGTEATVDAVLAEAYDGTTPYEWSTVWAVATGYAIDNNCGIVTY